MAVRAPVPYKQFKPDSTEYLPQKGISEPQRRFRVAALFWVAAAAFVGYGIAAWPDLLATLIAASAALASAILGGVYFLHARAEAARGPKPPMEVAAEPPRPSLDRRYRWERLAFMLAVVGILFASIVTPWYSYSVSQTDVTGVMTSGEVQTFYLGTSLTVTSTSCIPSCTSSSLSTHYASAGLNATGRLYAALLGLVLSAMVIAGIAGGLSVASDAISRRVSHWGRRLALVAALVALIAPLLVWALQPGALQTDHVGTAVGSGPWNSFAGTSYDGISGSSSTWGPAAGVGLPFLACILAFLGALIPEPITSHARRSHRPHASNDSS